MFCSGSYRRLHEQTIYVRLRCACAIAPVLAGRADLCSVVLEALMEAIQHANLVRRSQTLLELLAIPSVD